jgi:hypothetical protein
MSGERVLPVKGHAKFQDRNPNYLSQSTIIDGPGKLFLDIGGALIVRFFGCSSCWLFEAAFGTMGGMRAYFVSVGI